MKIGVRIRLVVRRGKGWLYRNRTKTFIVSSMPLRSFTIRGVKPASTIDHSHKRYALYEPFLVGKIMEVVSQRDRIYDIGAELGYYSKLFSEVIGAAYVTAFEPDSGASYWLRRNLNKRVRRVEKYIDVESSTRPEVNRIQLDHYISKQDRKWRPTVLKIDVEGAEAPIILNSKYIERERPRLFLEIHPTEIKQEFSPLLYPLFERLVSLYRVEMVRNHWGIVKTKGPLSVVDEDGSTDWRVVSYDDLVRVSHEIIDQKVQPICFALHCFVPLTDRLKGV